MNPFSSSRVPRLLVRWHRFAGIHRGQHEPGFLGPIPYILLLRYFVLGAVAVRFSLHKFQYSPSQWTNRLLITALIAATTLAATYVALNRGPRRSKFLQAGFILADVGFISVAYWLTNNPESDFFLLYYLPIFAAMEYLGGKSSFGVWVLIATLMGIVVFSIPPLPQPPWTYEALLWRVWIPRIVFSLAIIFSSAFVFHELSRRQAELRGLLHSLNSVGAAAAPSALALDEALEHILSRVATLRFEFATVSLVDEYRNCIETVRGRNTPPGWIRRARHTLDSRDIQARVVKTGRSECVPSSDGRLSSDFDLDREIYERFEHWKFARVFVPIVRRDRRVVGTIEAGCTMERRTEVITGAAVTELEQLGQEKGDEIAQARPHVLLEMIAQRAIRLIGAHSASLHVYRRGTSGADGNTGPEWGELILAAGAGKATHEFVKLYQPRPRGRGRTAIETGRAQWVDDPKEFARDYPSLCALGMTALAVIPLALGPDMDGVLGISFWRKGQRFTPREIHLATMFASEMEVVIQNHLLFRKATEAGGRAWALSGIQSLMQSLTSPFNLPEVLRKVAKNALLTFDANSVTVYQYRADDDKFDVPPVMEGHFIDPGSMKLRIRPNDMLFRIIRAGVPQFILDAQSSPLLRGTGDLDGTPFVRREHIKSCAILVLRPGETEEIVGLLFVNFCETHEFDFEERKVMNALATAAALAIRTARLHGAEVTRRKRELTAMHAVDKAIVDKAPNLPEVLQVVLQEALDITGGQSGEFMLVSPRRTLESVVQWPQGLASEPQGFGEGIIGLAALEKTSVLVGDAKSQEWLHRYKEVNRDTRSELAVPLLESNGDVLGVLNLESSKFNGFSQDDRVLMETLAVQAVVAVHSVDLYTKLGRRIQHMHLLNVIAAHAQEARDLETIFRLFLTGVTAREGLAFSRAMLFLVENDTLSGRLAIGAVTRQQAEKVWLQFKQADPGSLRDLDLLLRQTRQLGKDIQDGTATDDSLLNVRVREIALPLDKLGEGALAQCLRTCKAVIRRYGEADPFRDVIARLTERCDQPLAFACVPLVGKQREPIGVVVVDNTFLMTERSIDDEGIEGLNVFSDLLALMVENTRSQERLAEEQRFEGLKEVGAAVAHTVGTRLSASAGHLIRLRERLARVDLGDASQEVEGLLSRLGEGIKKGERILQEFRTFAATSRLQWKELDLRDLLADMPLDFRGEAQIEIVVPDEPLYMRGDASKLSDAFMEIMMNAHQATQGLARPKITVELMTALSNSERYAKVEIADNGPGVPQEIKENLFRPFFSTKGGTGLGLPIAKNVILRHGGSITVTDNFGGGTRFVIRLPIADSAPLLG